jgi:hypothetical protein
MTTNVALGLLLIAAAMVILADDLLYLVWRIARFQRLRPEFRVGNAALRAVVPAAQIPGGFDGDSRLRGQS